MEISAGGRKELRPGELDQVALFLTKLFCEVPATKIALAVATSMLAFFFPTEALQGAAMGSLMLVLVDAATGLRADMLAGHKWESAKFGRTINKLLAYMALSAVGAVNTRYIPGAAPLAGGVQTILLSFIIVRETGSILENVAKMGVDIPPWLAKWLVERVPKPASVRAEAEKAKADAE